MGEGAAEDIQSQVQFYIEQEKMISSKNVDHQQVYTPEDAHKVNKAISKQLYWQVTKTGMKNPFKEESIGRSSATNMLETMQAETMAEAMAEAQPLEVVQQKYIKKRDESKSSSHETLKIMKAEEK